MTSPSASTIILESELLPVTVYVPSLVIFIWYNGVNIPSIFIFPISNSFPKIFRISSDLILVDFFSIII